MNEEPVNRDVCGRFAVADLDYTLPQELIAQEPPARRDDARLLIVDRATGSLTDEGVRDLPDLLDADDLLVLNDTRVLPAKFTARRKSGGKVQGLFVQENRPGEWEVLLEGSRRLRIGEFLVVQARSGEAVEFELLEAGPGGHWRVRVGADGTVEQLLSRFGQTPLPPYIRRFSGEAAEHTVDAVDRLRYQTVYARRPGAIAAPTAGLHFTEAMLQRIRARGIETCFVTLHVGIGTFKPIDVDHLANHVMHAESCQLTPATAEAVNACRRRGGRVVAVGTTTVRVLESAACGEAGCGPGNRATGPERDSVHPVSGATDLFIHPPYHYRVVDAMLTNFHLPRSTLLALVMAFAGIEQTRRAYAHAIERRYRFYSYGDAMLIM